MTPLLSLLLVAPLTGEQAIARAKTILKGLDVAGPYRLAGLGRQDAPGDPGEWSVTLQGKDVRYDVVLRNSGRLRHVAQSRSLGGAVENPHDPNAAARVARWVKGYGPAFPIRPTHAKDEATGFFFAGLVKGLPVVYPRTRLGYQVMLQHGRLLEFSANEDVPEVGSPVPRLSEADALRAVDRLFRSQNPPKDGWTFSYHLYDHRELGWCVPPTGPTRLAWHVPFMFERSGRFGSQGGSSGMLIDAKSGEQIRTPTVP